MRACRQWKHLGLVSLCPRRNFSPFSLCEFGIRIFGRSSPLGIIGARCFYPEPTRIFFRPMRLFFVLPPRRKILSVIFFYLPPWRKQFSINLFNFPVEEDRSFFFLLSSATAESLPFFIELYIELASPSVPEMPADVVLVVRGDGSYPV